MATLAPVPLCPTHDERMRVDLATLESYICPMDGCGTVYTTEEGYFRVVDRTKENATNSKPCPLCGVQQYLAERGRIRLDDEWLCPNPACPSKNVRS
jgi:hypothetical protein